jgi:hypothetical protein
MFSSQRGFQLKGQVTKTFMGILVMVILGVAAVIPITQQIITDANLTGTLATIVGLIPLLVGIVMIVIIMNVL